MSEQKRYTAQEYRDLATQIDDECADAIAYDMTIASEFDVDSAQHLRDILRQAADAEEEIAQLKARLEAVVKNLEDMRKWCAFACVDQEDVDEILLVARGEGGVK